MKGTGKDFIHSFDGKLVTSRFLLDDKRLLISINYTTSRPRITKKTKFVE